MIDRAEDFRILNRVNRSAPAVDYSADGVPDTFLDNGKFYAMIMNQTDRSWAGNMGAVVETRYQLWLAIPIDQQIGELASTNFGCYFKEKGNLTGDYPGIHQDSIFEIAFLQKLYDGILSDEVSLPYDFSIDCNITDFFRMYDARDFHEALPSRDGAPLSQPMSAIGVQCKALGSIGNADINGIKSSSSNFQRTDTSISRKAGRCATRFTADVPFTVIGNLNKASAWMSSISASSAAPPLLYGSFRRTGDDRPTEYALLLGYLQAK